MGLIKRNTHRRSNTLDLFLPPSSETDNRVTAKMRLYLAVAVLMLAFVAYTEAQDEQTIEQKFAEFTRQMSEAGENVAAKAKENFDQFMDSKFVRDSQAWFQRQFQSLQEKAKAIGQ